MFYNILDGYQLTEIRYKYIIFNVFFMWLLSKLIDNLVNILDDVLFNI